MNLIVQIENNTGGWNIMQPDYKSLKFTNKKVDKKEFSRLTADGELLFLKSDYQFLQSLTNRIPAIRFIQNGNIIVNGTVDLEQDTDFDYQIMKLKSKVSDVYSSFEDFGDTEYNIINTVSENTEILYIYEDELEIETSGEREVEGIWFPPSVDGTGKPLTNLDYPDATYGLYYVHYGFVEGGVDPLTTSTYKRYIGYGYYDGTTAIPPSGTGWTYLSDVTVNNTIIPKYAKPIAEDEGFTRVDQGNERFYTNDTNLTAALKTYTRYKRVTSVLKFIVNKIDSSIKFEDNTTPALTDSFYWMKTYIGENYVPIGFTNYISTNKPYRDLMILQITDAIPDSSGDQKTNGASIGNLTFNILIDWFEQRGFYWKIEERANGNYFILDHYLNKNLSNTNKNLFQLSKINWVKKTNNIKYIEPTYNKIHNSETVGGDLDFVGVDVLFPNVNVKADLQWGGQSIFSDINDIRTFKEEKYNETATDQFVIVSTVDVSPFLFVSHAHVVKKATGDLTNQLRNNIELSWSYISQRLISNLPDVSANINGNLVSLSSKRLEKRKEVKFFVPLFDIKNDFDMTGLIAYYDNDSEINQIDQKATDDVGDMTILY